MSKAIDFLLGTGKNANGYVISELWQHIDNQTFNLDNDLQWLFPTFDSVGNGVKSTAEPIILTVDDANYCRENELIQNNQLMSLTHILPYFGFEVMGDTIGVYSNRPSFSPDAHLWLTKINYDALRLARIMTSLLILGHENLARQLQTLVIDTAKTYGEVHHTVTLYWTGALEYYDFERGCFFEYNFN